MRDVGLDPAALTRVAAVDGRALRMHDGALLRTFNLTGWTYGAARNSHQDHAYRRSVIGCALSHLAVWRAIARGEYDAEDGLRPPGDAAASADAAVDGADAAVSADAAELSSMHSSYLILEDDVTFVADFAARWRPLVARLADDHSWSVVWLGLLDDRDLYGDAPLSDAAVFPGPGVAELGSAARTFGGGAFAYVIRRRTAVWLVEVRGACGAGQFV